MKPLTDKQGKILAFIRDEIVAKGRPPTAREICLTKKGYRLQPENAAFKPIIVEDPEADFRLAGPVVGLVRRMG
jgi:SOS-response transcriptional repressor LexA